MVGTQARPLNSLRERLTRWTGPAKPHRSRLASTVLPGWPGSGETPTIATERGRSNRSMREVTLASISAAICAWKWHRVFHCAPPAIILLTTGTVMSHNSI